MGLMACCGIVVSSNIVQTIRKDMTVYKTWSIPSNE